MEFSQGFETLLLLGAVQGFILALILPKMERVNRQAQLFLSFLLLATSVSLIFYLQIVVYRNWPGRMLAFLDTSAFLFAPLVYLYIRALLFKKKLLLRRIVLHFLPAFLHLLYGISLFRYSDGEIARLFELDAFRNEWLFIFGSLVGLTLLYWAFCVKMVLRFKSNYREITGQRQNIRYVSLFLGALLLGDLISIVFGMDYFFGWSFFAVPKIYIGWIIVPFLVYVLTYVAIGRPEIMRVAYPKKKNTVKRLSKEDMKLYAEMLERSMKVDRLYLDPKLDLNQLADALRIPPTKLSYVINTHYTCHFYDFVNRYRVEDFVKKLQQNEHKNHTLLALAYDAGFNSKTTFNKSFKAIFQLTPRQYLKNLTV